MRLRLLTLLAAACAGMHGAAPANSASGVHYVGSKVCAGCHMAIYRSFVKTAMGRSAASMPAGSNLVPADGVTVYSRELDRYFQVFRKGADVYQSEYALGADRRELFRNTHKLVYEVGALENGDSYLVQRGNRLYEAPLSYYATLGKWALAPGYEQTDSGFSRAVPLACAACHTGLPKPVNGAADGTYEEPPFAELAIGCERCHGPGELHVQAKSSGHPGSDPLIVNPAKLPGWLSDNICMSCHENGSGRVLRPGKTPADFRPGTPLDETIPIFASLSHTDESASSIQVLSHYQAMIASACYRTSGKMSCTTCHDPHVEPASAFDYRPKCLACHTVSSCKATAASRQATTPLDNCMQCHMPKRPVTTIAHSALTDHRIIRQAGEPMPDLGDDFSKKTGLLHLTAVPGEANVSPEILFRAYTEALPSDPSLRQKWGELMQTLMRNGTNDPYVLAQAGSLLVARATAQADLDAGTGFLQAAVAANIDLPGVYVLLAKTLAERSDVAGAVDALQRGIAVDPTNREAYRSLIQLYANAGQFDKVLEVGKKYLDEFPQDVEMRESLERISRR